MQWAKTPQTLIGPGDEKKRLGQSASKAEIDRQQILEEMKKRTQLLTDNSWIRQRSSSFYKEPIYVGVPMKRYESLDNLDIVRQSPLSATTFSYPRPHSAAAGYCAPSRNASSRYSTGALLSQRNTFDSSHPGSVWAATDISEELRLESRFESEKGGPTVSPAISDSSSLVPPPCDQHAVLQIIEWAAESPGTSFGKNCENSGNISHTAKAWLLSPAAIADTTVHSVVIKGLLWICKQSRLKGCFLIKYNSCGTCLSEENVDLIYEIKWLWEL